MSPPEQANKTGALLAARIVCCITTLQIHSGGGGQCRFNPSFIGLPLHNGSSEESLHHRLRKLASRCVNVLKCELLNMANFAVRCHLSVCDTLRVNLVNRC